MTGTLTNPKTTMIGLKPLTQPIKSIFDLLSGTEEDEKKETKQEEENMESDM